MVEDKEMLDENEMDELDDEFEESFEELLKRPGVTLEELIGLGHETAQGL